MIVLEPVGHPTIPLSGEKIISIISLFQYKTFSRVERNGLLSSNIPLSRGNGQVSTLNKLMHILKWCKQITGLDITNIKKWLKIGALKGRSIPWEGECGFEWTNTFDILGITYNIDELGRTIKFNIINKNWEIKNLVNIWNSRNLTPLGKIAEIMSLLMSKPTHLLLCLPRPDKHCLDYIDCLS